MTEKLIADLESQIQIVNEQFECEVRSAQDLLRAAVDPAIHYGRTHLGSNLSSRAHNLSVLTGRLQELQSVLAHVRANALS